MAIKKAFEPIIEILEANRNSKVSTVLDQILELASAKKAGGGNGGTTFVKNEAGEVVAVRCYYLQKWVDPRTVEFGAKAGTPTGLSTMCKYGTSMWTKQQREYKKAQAELLARVTSGEVSPAELPALLADAEAARDAIVLPDSFAVYDTAEECIAASQQ